MRVCENPVHTLPNLRQLHSGELLLADGKTRMWSMVCWGERRASKECGMLSAEPALELRTPLLSATISGAGWWRWWWPGERETRDKQRRDWWEGRWWLESERSWLACGRGGGCGHIGVTGGSSWEGGEKEIYRGCVHKWVTLKGIWEGGGGS